MELYFLLRATLNVFLNQVLFTFVNLNSATRTLLFIFVQEAERSSKPDEILESKVDAAEWNLEVERVLPQLKVTIRTDNKVRPHLNTTGIWRLGIKQVV